METENGGAVVALIRVVFSAYAILWFVALLMRSVHISDVEKALAKEYNLPVAESRVLREMQLIAM